LASLGNKKEIKIRFLLQFLKKSHLN